LSAQNIPTGAQATPTMDEIADAALRATTRAAGVVGAAAQAPNAVPMSPSSATSQFEQPRTPERTGPVSPAGPLHRILEGTIVDAVLTNRLDGTTAAPVNCLVTNPLYSHSGQHILIPAGARVLGETKPVQSFGETRLAVSFHRLVMPDGRTYRLDEFLGLNQIGDAGLKDRVNQHYLATFGAAAAVGLISGLSQFIGSAGLGRGDGDDRTVIIAGGVGDSTSQATLQVMNRFLNRLPTVTIREGHRVKVYLTSDLELPAYVWPPSF
jgi:type IV secretion system protein VirB10